ncbi:hypothetical protein H5410_002136, partial [Solanum commersonii]
KEIIKSGKNESISNTKEKGFESKQSSNSELANKFKIKREQLANEHNDRAKKEHAPIPHKRKNSKDFIPQQGKRKGQNKQRLFQSGESIQEKGIKLPMNNSRFQTSFKEGVTASVHVTGTTLGNGEVQHDIEELLNFKQVKRKSVLPSTRIHIDDETKRDNHTIADVLGEDECDVEEEIGIDCSTKEISKPKKVRGQTTCKDIHAKNLEERKEVTFDKGQAVGPTNKIVSELSNFIGTIARNPRFISLMYTSCHAVPNDIKKRMWEYINRAAKDNNEEPSKSEMFIATRTKAGKEIGDTSCNKSPKFGEAVMMHLGRIVTTSSLKKDEEINNLKQKHIYRGCVGSNLASLVD